MSFPLPPALAGGMLGQVVIYDSTNWWYQARICGGEGKC